MADFEDIDLTPPEPLLHPEVVRYLHENFSRIREEFGGTDWQNLTLLNNWVNFDAATYAEPRIRRYPGGLVEIQGNIKDGSTSIADALFVVPAGHRSDTRIYFNVPTGVGATAQLYLDHVTNSLIIGDNVLDTLLAINFMWMAADYFAAGSVPP